MNLKIKLLLSLTGRGCREIALRCAKDHANVVIIGKTTEPHEKLKVQFIVLLKK